MQNFKNIMNQMQQMQSSVTKIKQELADKKVTSESGAGLVKVTMKGNHDIVKVDISEKLLDEDKEIIEDLVAVAVNDANRRLQVLTEEHMAQFSAKLGLPPNIKLPL